MASLRGHYAGMVHGGNLKILNGGRRCTVDSSVDFTDRADSWLIMLRATIEQIRELPASGPAVKNGV